MRVDGGWRVWLKPTPLLHMPTALGGGGGRRGLVGALHSGRAAASAAWSNVLRHVGEARLSAEDRVEVAV